MASTKDSLLILQKKVANIVDDTRQHNGKPLFKFEIMLDPLSGYMLSSPWFSLDKGRDGTQNVVQYPKSCDCGNCDSWSDRSISTSDVNDTHPTSDEAHPIPPFCQIHNNVQKFIEVWGTWNNVHDINWRNIVELNSFRDDGETLESHSLEVSFHCMKIGSMKARIFDASAVLSHSLTNQENGSKLLEQLTKHVMTLPHVVFVQQHSQH